MEIVATADTHGLHSRLKLPTADVLIVAGDICPSGNMADVQDFGEWLRQQPFSYKIVIAGNHDKPFEVNQVEAVKSLVADDPTVHYLQDSEKTIKGIKFYGSPWTPTFYNWHFMANRGGEIREKWAMIPSDVDVLITHGPPAGILDNVNGIPQGCADLLEQIEVIRPKYNIFGHIHEGYGMRQIDEITFINASLCDARYRPVNMPVEVGL